MIDLTKRVRATGPRPAQLAVVGMAPARDEVRTGRPFTGSSGQILNESLQMYGMTREDVFVTNLVEFPIELGSSVYEAVPKELRDKEFERLRQELLEVRPNCVLLCGNDPLQAFTGHRAIGQWRGSIIQANQLLANVKCVPCQHPAAFIRGLWKWLPVFRYVDLPRAVEESKVKGVVLPERRAITGPSKRQVMDYLQYLRSKRLVTVDIETNGTEITCVGLGASKDEALSIPFTRSGYHNYWNLDEEADIWLGIANLLQAPDVQLVAQNAAFEWLYFWRYGIYPRNLYCDTMTLHHCLYPDFGGTQDPWGRKKRSGDEPGHSLAFINSQYTRTPYYKEDGRLWKPEYGDTGFWRYNAMDVMVTHDVMEQMVEEAQAKNLWQYYQDYYVRAFRHALRMEWFGVKINLDLRAKAREELVAHAAELQETVDGTLGYRLNVNSPKQMNKLLYETKGYQVRRNPKTGRPTADKGALRYFADKKGDTLLEDIVKLRETLDLIGDIIDQPLGPQGRMHTHFKLGGTDGQRWSSTESILGSGTNLQNIPREGVARKLFIPG